MRELTEAERDVLIEASHPSRPDREALLIAAVERIIAQARREGAAEALDEAASDVVADCSNQPGPCICTARHWLRERAAALTHTSTDLDGAHHRGDPVTKSARDLPDIDERLLWMLRILADEFGPLGVLWTCFELWPDAMTGLLSRALSDRDAGHDGDAPA